VHFAPEVSQSSSVIQIPPDFPYVLNRVKSVVHILTLSSHHPLTGSHPVSVNFFQSQAPLYLMSIGSGSTSSTLGLGAGEGAVLGLGEGEGEGVKPDVLVTKNASTKIKESKATIRGFFIYISLLFLFGARLWLFATRSFSFSCR
jgi:hypothetical protein